MLFNTAEFGIFFVVVFGLYWLLHAASRRLFRWQNLLLLAASYVFYGWWDIRFLFLIAISTSVDYCSALMIARGRLSALRRVKVSLYLLAAAMLFVVMRYDALDLGISIRGVRAHADWASLLPANLGGWWVLIAAGAAVAIGNIAYPWAARLPEETRRKAFVFLSVAVNLSILGFFKYFDFFADSFTDVSQAVFGAAPSQWTLNIILPVGISFYTFQTMSYTIDVYRRQVDASDRLLDFATYLAFFTQLVAGPIERGKHLLPQFQQSRPALTWIAWRQGVWLIAWGLFKKMVIADNMATIVNQTFGPYDAMAQPMAAPEDGLRVLLAVYAFALQIYGDFSGYTDIARGTARLLGFDIMLNFNLPYFATSPSSFWRRWHISLSTWLRDYLYIPLGGNRGGSLLTYRNLFLTMLLGGLWHGAAWTFVLWGAFHGLLLAVYRALGIRTEKRAYSWPVSVLMGLLMFHLTCLGWLIFRAQNVETIGLFLKSICLSSHGSPEAWATFCDILYYSWFLILFQVIQAATRNLDPMANRHWFIRLNVWVYVIMSLLVIASRGGQEFIYFAF